MVKLVHEIWLYRHDDDDEEELPMCVLAGPQGAGARAWAGETARLLCTFEAGSHFEAMTIYNEILGREPYSTEHSWDYEPYPPGWLEIQREGVS